MTYPSNTRRYIHVDTVPNGYTLTVDDNEYMLFTEEKLVGSMFKHISLGDEKEEDPEMMVNLMQSAASWSTLGELHEANARLMTEVKDAQRETRVARKQLSDCHDKIDALARELNEVKQKLAVANIQLEKYAKLKKEREELLLKEARLTERKIKEYEKDRKNDKAKKASKKVKNSETPADKPKPKASQKPKASPKRPVIEYSDKVQAALDTPLTLDKTGLPTRVLNVLRIAGGKMNSTIADVAGLSRTQLLETKGCGTLVLDQFTKWLEDHGLALHMNVKATLKGAANKQQ